MTRILVVKISSLGDIIHNLPVIADIRRHFPRVLIDWVVEEGFAAIPALHAGVCTTIPVAIRRWRRMWWRGSVRSEVRAFLHALRRNVYDAVIDTQGLLKSALIVCAAHGTRYGLDWRSSREPLALFYDRTFSVPWTLHAVERNRLLAGRALDYTISPGVDYGIRAPAASLAWLPAQPYVVLLHATSDERKLWPEACWVELGAHLSRHGMRCVLPWGAAAERERSERLAAQLPDAIVPPALRLAEVAGLLGGAQAVMGVDTGLTHLAAALDVPTVGIYGATDPAATGIYGCARAVNLGSASGLPQATEVIAAVGRLTT